MCFRILESYNYKYHHKTKINDISRLLLGWLSFSGFSILMRCGPSHILNSDGICTTCPDGHVLSSYRRECVECSGDKIAKAGSCIACPPGQTPMNNRTICASMWYKYNIHTTT